MGVRSPSYQAGFYAPERGGRPAYPGPWRGCVGAWNPGLGPSGLVLREWSGRKNHGTLTNGPVWSTSTGRHGIELDGVNDSININRIQFDSAYSLSCYFLQKAVVETRIIFGDSTDSGPFIGSLASATTISYRGITGAVLGYTVPAMAANVLYHLTVTRSPANLIRVFLNGAESSSGGQTQATPFSLNLLGSYFTPSLGLRGLLSDVLAHTRALSASEISLLARRPSIAYELAARRFISLPPSSARLRRILTGAT